MSNENDQLIRVRTIDLGPDMAVEGARMSRNHGCK